jgi:hypothetical protein
MAATFAEVNQRYGKGVTASRSRSFAVPAAAAALHRLSAFFTE